MRHVWVAFAVHELNDLTRNSEHTQKKDKKPFVFALGFGRPVFVGIEKSIRTDFDGEFGPEKRTYDINPSIGPVFLFFRFDYT